MKKLYIIILILFGLSCLSFSQTQIEKVETLNNAALSENINQNYDAATVNITKAIKLSETLQNNYLDAKLRYTAALIYSNKKESQTALQYFLSSANFYEKTQNDSMLAIIFSQTAKIYFETEAFEKSAENSKKAIIFNKKINSEFTISAELLQLTGDAYTYVPNSDSALFYYKNLYEKAKLNNSEKYLVIALQKISSVYKKQKNYQSALQANSELNNIYTKNNDITGIAVATNNIAFFQMNLKNYKDAVTGFKKAINLQKQANFDEQTTAGTYLNLGICQQNNNNLDEAVKSLNTAVEIYKKNNNSEKTAGALNLLALVYFNADDLYNASTHSEESIDYALKSGNKEILSDCYRTYSKILQAGNDYEKALDIYKKHLSINDSLIMEQKLHDQDLARKIFELERSEKNLKLQLADEEVKNLAYNQLKLEAEKKEKELELYKKEKELELSEQERLMQVMKLSEQQHKNMLKEQQIKNLEAQKALQDMQLKQTEIEQKNKEKQLQLLKTQSENQKLEIEKNKQARQKFFWIFSLVIIILALIVFALIHSVKLNKILTGQKKEIEEINEELNLQNEEINAQKEYLQNANDEINTQKEELQSKKDELESKNAEITSSINYAQKIQFAILPPLTDFSKEFPENFILYKPKDIVSGDFYWTKKIGPYQIIAIADCTGHGVPGAFMSMLGTSFLNEILSKARFDSAAEVLNRLRNKIKQALRQTGSSHDQKDGMDISLLVINKEEMTLQFAGANNSALLIRNNETQILTADRMPIGIHHKEAPFNNIDLKIEKNDVIYAHSDGYQDQFGGTNGRKFLSKNLRELFLKIHKEPLDKQKELLEEALQNWMSYKDSDGLPHKQVDDILIFGMKI